MKPAVPEPPLSGQLFDVLVAEGLVPVTELTAARQVALREGKRLDRILLRLGLTEESRLLVHVCRLAGIARLDQLAAPPTLDEEQARLLTMPYLSANLAAPLLSPGPEQLVALADPAETATVRELSFLLDRPVIPVGATAQEVRGLLRSAGSAESGEGPADGTRLTSLAASAAEPEGPVIRYVQEQLADAVTAGASDIHFEAGAAELQIRLRINGVLVGHRGDITVPAAAVMARLKVLAGLNVAEHRLPQDGRFTSIVAGRTIDFRVSSIPTQPGESIVCRILDPHALRLGWGRLGFSSSMAEDLRRIVERPSGLFLVTGPTGAGKTTTLYTLVAHLNDGHRKIVTVEDPVEYNLQGVQQVQVREDIGLTFARVLRSILRHDPNIILVGEIRDGETAEIACRAAQVGRLVLSTLHTNSADAAQDRLVDLGVPRFVVNEVLQGVLAQQLVTIACKCCSGTGCPECDHSGTTGRRLDAVLRTFPRHGDRN